MAKNKFKLTAAEFNRKINTVSLLLLTLVVVVLIGSSNILERIGEKEIERSYITGDATGSMNITIIERPEAEEAAAAAAAVEEAAPSVALFKSGSKVGIGGNDRFEIDLLKGGSASEELMIENTAPNTVEFSFGTTLKDLIEFEPLRIILEPGEKGTVIVRFIGTESGVFTGYISATGGGLRSLVPVILNIGSSKAVGKLSVNLPKQFVTMIESGDVLVSLNMEGFSNDRVEVVYIVKNSYNQEIMRTSQFLTVKDSLKLDKTLSLPQGLGNGLYVVGVEVRYKGITLVDSAVITIDSKAAHLEKPSRIEEDFKMSENTFKLLILLIAVMLVVSFLIYNKEMRGINKVILKKKS